MATKHSHRDTSVICLRREREKKDNNNGKRKHLFSLFVATEFILRLRKREEASTSRLRGKNVNENDTIFAVVFFCAKKVSEK